MVGSTTENAILSRMFSTTVFKDLARKGHSRLLQSLLRNSGMLNCIPPLAPLSETFEFAFRKLKSSGIRDEYVFRNAITQKILLGKHSLRSTSMLSEFRAANCRADLVILNGTACAYEIKSDRDNLTRLGEQVSAYSKVFASVNVVSSERYVPQLMMNLPEEIGVVALTPRFQLATIRRALDIPERIDSRVVFESLSTSEAAHILVGMNERIPEIPNIELRSALLRRFVQLDSTELHLQMVKTLKKTRSLEYLDEQVRMIPLSLIGIALACRPTRLELAKVAQLLDVPTHEYVNW